jgi:hypothetical protein
MFYFSSEEDVKTIRSRFWIYKQGSLVLTSWHPTFNPSKETLTKRHPWVLLHDLPLYFWSKEIIITLENLTGRYICMDEKMFGDSKKRMEKVMIELETKKNDGKSYD